MKRNLFVLGMVFMFVAVLGISLSQAQDKKPFNVKGLYVEGCSCSAPCGCEMTGLEMGCEGVGAVSISSGKYNGVDLSGVKIALGLGAGDWSRAYVQVAKPEQKEAAEAFAKAMASNYGKVEEIKDAKIDITGKDGKYTVKVDDGKIMELNTEPVIGGDNKTPVAHTNTHNALNSTMYQAKSISGTFTDGRHTIKLKDSNSYFNTKMSKSGNM